MGMRMPKTCWAVSKWPVINLWSWCILLVDSVECFTKFCIFPVYPWANYLEQNLKVIFCFPDKILNPEPSSVCSPWRRLFPCSTPLLNKCCIHKCFTYFGCFFLIGNVYPTSCQLQLHSMTWLDWQNVPSTCGHKTLYVIRMWTVRIHCTLMWTRLEEYVLHIWMTTLKKMTYMMQWSYSSGRPVCLHGMNRDNITFTLNVLRHLLSLQRDG
jgi:hypothetical protein